MERKVAPSSVDLRLEREDLVPARVGEHVAGPVHEPVQAAELGDQVGARAQHQVVRVGQDQRDAHRLEVLGVERLHRRPGADRHEQRGGQHARGAW